MATLQERPTGPTSTLFPTIRRDDGLSPTIHPTLDSVPTPMDRPWVLCVDDDQEFLHGLKLKLQSRGYDVIRAFEGMDGYRFAFEFDPVAILLDLHLPNGTGEEILSRLCEHPTTAHIPVIIVTGLNEQGLEHRMMASGASEFLRKPIGFSQLVNAIDRYGHDAGSKFES